MSQWLKNLTGCLCILTVLLHLVPKGKFSSYVRFYGGLLFFLVAAGPLWRLIAGEGELERFLRLEFLKDDFYDLETSMTGMAELKNDQIKEAYRSEIARQIQEIAFAYGIRAENVQLLFDEDGYRMTDVSFDAGMMQGDIWTTQETLPAQGAALPDAVEAARQEIAGVYMLDLDHIRIRREESGEWKNGSTE